MYTLTVCVRYIICEGREAKEREAKQNGIRKKREWTVRCFFSIGSNANAQLLHPCRICVYRTLGLQEGMIVSAVSVTIFQSNETGRNWGTCSSVCAWIVSYLLVLLLVHLYKYSSDSSRFGSNLNELMWFFLEHDEMKLIHRLWIVHNFALFSD